MVENQLDNNIICRLCLFKCENPRNMLADKDFGKKVMEVFPKIIISPENKLSTLVCDYCHNLILQFYGYFEKVNANQEELMKLLLHKNTTVDKTTNILSIDVDISYKDEPESISHDDEIWLQGDSQEECLSISSDIVSQPVKTSVKNTPKTTQIPDMSQSNLTYNELLELPINFTYSFRCIKCEKSDKFLTRMDLRKHYLKVHFKSTKPIDRESKIRRLMKRHDLLCDLCDKNLVSTASDILQDHKFFHYNLKPYVCGMAGCSNRSNSKKQLKKHMHLHLEGKRYLCPYCHHRRSTSTEARDSHIIKEHPEKILECRKCDKILTLPRDVKSHFRKHITDVKLECDRCPGGILFDDEKILNLHKQRHIIEDKYPKKYRCKLCERTFNSQNSYNVHLKNHDPASKNTLYTCRICGKTVTRNNNENFTTHERLHQKNDGDFKCPHCDESFAKKPRLRAHMRKEHSSKQNPCDRCGQLLYEHTLTRHLKHCVGGGLRCAHCPLTFDNKNERYKHSQLMHIGYNCKKCNMKFANKSELNKHIKRDPAHKRTTKVKTLE